MLVKLHLIPSIEISFSMGRLKYDGTSGPIAIDDVTLAHLKIIIGTKLRRQESFMMTWCPVGDGPDARATIWLHPAIPIQFGFDHAQLPQIDPARIKAMMAALNATGELNLDNLEGLGGSGRSQGGEETPAVGADVQLV